MTETEQLEVAGWKLIGSKRYKYGHIHCWIPPDNSKAAEDPRPWWTQGDAIAELRQDKRRGVLP